MPVPLAYLLIFLASNGIGNAVAIPLTKEVIVAETSTPGTIGSSSLNLPPGNDMIGSPALPLEQPSATTTTRVPSSLVSSTKDSTLSIISVMNLPQGVPPCYAGTVPFTQYWIPKENNWDENEEGERIWLEKGGKEPLLDENNATIAFVSKSMKDKCNLEGTCLLDDGNLINVVGGSERFKIIGKRGRSKNIFGFGNKKRNLAPFVSIASNDLPHGQTIFLPQLNGTRLANGMIHNGCVRVDDDGTSFDGCQLDFFVVSYLNYLVMGLGNQAYMEFKQCTPLNYATKEMLQWMEADTTTVSHILDDQREDWNNKIAELNAKIKLPGPVVA
ncbi:hypothetical protein NQZ79_g384 [Umbelopsis isabellina]|nr:hypothetical protein NQZ79_g384 [Umbelopsis isabellina]